MKTTPAVFVVYVSIIAMTAGAASGETPLPVRADSQTVAQAISGSMSVHERLFAAVDKYSSKLLAGDWKEVYMQWSPLFRRDTSEDEFVRSMISSKYDVAEYEVKRYVVDDNAARLVVRISDSEGPPFFAIALWGMDHDGQWFCIDDGTQRIRMPQVLFGEEDLVRELIQVPIDSSSRNSRQDASVEGNSKDRRVRPRRTMTRRRADEVVPKNWTGVEAMKCPARQDHEHVDKTPRICG